jgi:hypothetical protein
MKIFRFYRRINGSLRFNNEPPSIFRVEFLYQKHVSNAVLPTQVSMSNLTFSRLGNTSRPPKRRFTGIGLHGSANQRTKTCISDRQNFELLISPGTIMVLAWKD